MFDFGVSHNELEYGSVWPESTSSREHGHREAGLSDIALWITSGLPTSQELIGLVNRSAFMRTNAVSMSALACSLISQHIS
jgi:hypothetical protein